MNAILHYTSLDPIDTDPVFEWMFDFRETEPYSNTVNGSVKYEAGGYDSSNFFLLLGPAFFFMVIFPVYAILKKILRKIGKKLPCKNRLTKLMKKKVKYTIIITRFLLEGCLEMGISAIITIKMMSKENFDYAWEAASTVSAFIVLLALAIAPLYLGYIIAIHVKMIKHGKKSKHADFFENLRDKPSSLIYQVTFFQRRYCMIFIITLLSNSGFYSIHGQMISTMYVVAYLLLTRPFKANNLNNIELVNEITVLMAAYPLLVFMGDWVWNVHIRFYCGWYLIGCIVFTLLLNTSILVIKLIVSTYKKLRQKWIKRINKKIIEKRFKQAELELL